MKNNIKSFWVKGWSRKYESLSNQNNPYVSRVYCRLLDASKRLQDS